ncbi:hypothetical protein PRIPAC_97456 [Pristionchus pacificus]|nr:hypothetical protein PRIPAC_97456 [Pristionchus pacificus]
MEQSSSSSEKARNTETIPDGSDPAKTKDTEEIGNATIESGQGRSRAAKEAAKRKLAESDDSILDMILETKKDRNPFRRVIMDSDDEESMSGDDNKSGGNKMSDVSDNGSDDNSDEDEYEAGFEEEDDEEYDDDDDEEGPSDRRPVKRMAGMSPLERPKHSAKSYLPKLNRCMTGMSSNKNPSPSAGNLSFPKNSSELSIQTDSPPNKPIPSAAILKGYKDANYDGETDDEMEEERFTPSCPSEISNTSTSESFLEMPLLERQDFVKDTDVPIKYTEAPKKSQRVFNHIPEQVIPKIEFDFPPFISRPSTIRPPLDLPLPGCPSFESLSGTPCPRVYLNKMKIKGLVKTGKILGDIAFKPDLYLPESCVRVSMFYYNATRDSDVWLQTPTATVSVRYGKEMKVPFVATIDMTLYVREGENTDSLVKEDSLLREETLGFIGIVECDGVIRRSKEERMVFKKRPSILPYMYSRPVVSSPKPSHSHCILAPSHLPRSQPPSVRTIEPYIEDPGIASVNVDSSFVLPPAGEICEKILFTFDSFTFTSGTSSIRPSIELPIPGCPTVGSLNDSSKNIPRILLNRTKMREFINSGTVSGRIEFTPENWPEATLRVSIFYFNGIRNTTEWSRSPFFTFLALKRREMRMEFTATVDMKVYLREGEDPTTLLDEDSLLRAETLSFVAVVAAEGVVLRSKEERMLFRKKKYANRQINRREDTQQAHGSAWNANTSGEEYVY